MTNLQLKIHTIVSAPWDAETKTYMVINEVSNHFLMEGRFGLSYEIDDLNPHPRLQSLLPPEKS